MKKVLLFLIFLILGEIIYCQETINNFKIENGELQWQKIYDTELIFDTTLTFDALISNIKASMVFEKIEISNNRIFGEFKPFYAFYNESGYNRMSAPIYIVSSSISGSCLIDYKDGRYRVTVKKIIMTQSYTDPLSEMNERTPLDEHALSANRSSFRYLFKKTASIILDDTFSKICRFEIIQDDGDEW